MSEVLWPQPDRSHAAVAIAEIPFAEDDASADFGPRIARVSTPHPEPRNPSLRHWLGGLDAAVAIVANLVGWMVLPGASGLSVGGRLLLAMVGALATVLAIAGQGLYRARACAVRSVELVGLARAATAGAFAGLIVGRLLSQPVPAVAPVAAGAFAFLGLAAGRGLFSAWLRRARAHGRFCRSIVVVGAEAEAGRLVWLLRRHPELGLRPVGVMGRGLDEDTLAGVPCLGDLDAVGPTLALLGANGVVIASADLDSEDLNVLVRKLLTAGVHVQLSNGLWGIDHHRLRPVPLAHEPFVYVEPTGLRRGQRACKRAVDTAVSSLLLLVSLPIFALCAIAIRFQDGAPAIFRQVRIGRDGVPFTLFKLRTMVPDAEQQLVDVTSVNQRAGGPLFKASHDPRRTPVGRLLERTSLDLAVMFSTVCSVAGRVIPRRRPSEPVQLQLPA